MNVEVVNDLCKRSNVSHQSAVVRHLETIDVLWCDGHVKAMKPDALMENRSITYAGFGTKPVATNFTIQDD